MLYNEIIWTVCRLCNPLPLSNSDDWVFRVIKDALDPPKIFNIFSIDFLLHLNCPIYIKFTIHYQ